MSFISGKNIALFILCACLLQASPVYSLEIVVGDKVEQMSISKSDLRMIFSGRMKYWPDGNPIRTIIISDGDNDAHKEFCYDYINFSPPRLRRTWNRVIFSNTGEAPIFISDESQIKDVLAKEDYSIGYISDSIDKEGLNVLSIK